jgi:ABC-type multidrug transport system ATPase subunit
VSATVALQGVSHTWAAGSPWAVPALAGVDLRLEAGSRVAIVGGNGAGKSTLAWIVAGVLAPTEGTATIDGAPLAGSPRVALALQHARLQLLRPTVERDLGLDPAGVRRALAEVGLDRRDAHRAIDDLSGGEQRRVALAALLARDPDVLVCDEPLAGLDIAARSAVVDALRRRWARGTTLVSVVHEPDAVALLADRVVQLEAGRIVADVPVGRWTP